MTTTPSNQTTPTLLKAAAKNVLLSLLVAAVFLGLIEVAARLFLKYGAERYVNYDFLTTFRKEPEIFETRTIDGREYYFASAFPTKYYSDINDTRGKKILKDKTPKVFRIFAFGGSSIAGSPFGHWGSFSQFLTNRLEALKRDGVEIEVVNFGVSRFGSTRALRLMERTIDHKPDLILVYAGDNEVCDDNDLLQAKEKPSAMAFGFNHLATVRLGVLMLTRLRADRPAPGQENFMRPVCEINGKHRMLTNAQQLDLLSERYRGNMEKMRTLAESKGIAIAFTSQLANYFVPPALSDNVEGKGKPLAKKEAALLKLSKSGSETEVASAIAALLKEDPDNATAYFVQAIRYASAGNFKAAHGNFLNAVENDYYHTRFRATYERILRALDARQNGVYYVDAAGYVSSQLDDGIIDGRVVMDAAHPSITGNQLIAEALLQEVFLKSETRSDLFDYERYRRWDFSETAIEPERYLNVCQRFTKQTSWRECLMTLTERYQKDRSLKSRHVNVHVWEFLHYHALAVGGSSKLSGETWRNFSELDARMGEIIATEFKKTKDVSSFQGPQPLEVK